jgi:hypothetical protein
MTSRRTTKSGKGAAKKLQLKKETIRDLSVDAKKSSKVKGGTMFLCTKPTGGVRYR